MLRWAKPAVAGQPGMKGFHRYCNLVCIGICILVVSGITFFRPVAVHSEVLLENTVWEGEVLVEENLLIPRGITLTVKPNTTVKVNPADGTRTDPEYMSSLTEITVRGTLLIEGDPAAPVVFRLNPLEGMDDVWAGIIIDGGTARIRSCTIRDAESGVWIVAGKVDLFGSTLTSNHYGLVAQRETTSVSLSESVVTGNEYGLLALNGAIITQKDSRVTDNLKQDFRSRPAENIAFELKSYAVSADGIPVILTDEVLRGDTVWEGHVLVNGRPRVPVDSRLIILPGTIVEFSKKDTNGDGIGENGLMLQGVLIAKGTAEKPIIFRSAEKKRTKGDWDAVNIINSDGVRNIIEYIQFEDAYRGLHFHFSNAVVQHSVFRHNYRGVQFQESTVELRGNDFYANTSAIQARDSEIVFIGNQLRDNVFGANFLRAHLTIEENRFGNNLDFGLKVREGFPTVKNNIFHHNRFGLMFSDTTYGAVSGNIMLQNSESGLSIRTGANMEISGNFVQGNGLSGIAVRDASAVIKDNHISENGERGIGLISFVGLITHNIFVNNYLYAIAAEDDNDVSAPSNFYGQDDVEALIFDAMDEPGRGRIQYTPVADEPFPFVWPMAKNSFDVAWYAKIIVPETVSVPAGATLVVKPGATILFAEDAGLNVQGKLVAVGTKDQRIRFTAAEGREPETWDEVRIEYADGSRFLNCDFEYATWGIHSHFNPLSVNGCSFRNNGGGIRFRSGPLLITNSLFSDNGIGIRAYRGKAEISNNSITRNDKGIFVREQGGGLLIKNNNIFANRDYNIWVGDFNLEDIQAVGNWWGTEDPEETFFDARREPGIGTIHYQPALTEPVKVTIVDQEQK